MAYAFLFSNDFFILFTGANTRAAVVSTLSKSLSTVISCSWPLDPATASVVCGVVVEDALSALRETVLPVKVEAALEDEGWIWDNIDLWNRAISFLCLCGGWGYNWKCGLPGISHCWRSLHRYWSRGGRQWKRVLMGFPSAPGASSGNASILVIVNINVARSGISKEALITPYMTSLNISQYKLNFIHWGYQRASRAQYFSICKKTWSEIRCGLWILFNLYVAIGFPTRRVTGKIRTVVGMWASRTSSGASL